MPPLSKRNSYRQSLSGNGLPPLATSALPTASAATGATPIASPTTEHDQASSIPAKVISPSALAAAAAYKSLPTELVGTLSRVPVVDRSGMAQKRIAEENKRIEKELKLQLANANAPFGDQALATAAASSSTATSSSSSSSSTTRSPYSDGPLGGSLSARPHTVHANSLRIPTPLPNMRHTLSNARIGSALIASEANPINLHLPGSQSARSASSHHSSSLSSSVPPPPSSLAAITQDTNFRLERFLRRYEGDRRSDSQSSNSKALTTTSSSNHHQLLLSHMTNLTAKEIEEEKEVSRLLANWNPQKNGKSFTTLSNKIRHIISDRISLFEGHFQGKTLTEEGGFIGEEIEKKRQQFFKFHVAANIGIVRLDVEVAEGRVEMYVATGEPVTQASYLREKDRVWSMRVGVGHHNLTIHSSDANYKANETFYVTIYALQQAQIQIKLTFGGKNKATVASTAAAGNPGDENSGSNPSANTASGNNNQNANQGGTVSGGFSLKNLRKTLLARVKALQDSPTAMKEFQTKISLMKKHAEQQRAGSQRSNNIHPPAHLSLSALHALNQAEAEAERAMEEAKAKGEIVPQTTLQNAALKKKLPPTRPYPLTPSSLVYIAHIRAITGVSELFYTTAKELKYPRAVDENDFILTDISGEPPPPATGRNRSAAANTAANASSSGESKESPTRANSLHSMSPKAHRGGAEKSLAATITPAAAAAAAAKSSKPAATGDSSSSIPTLSGPPVLLRRSSVSNVLRSIIERVCARLRRLAQQLKHTAAHSQYALYSKTDDRYALGMVQTSGEYQRLQQTHNKELVQIEEQREQAQFYLRAAVIYEAHLSEIEGVLYALACGDVSDSHVARYIVEPVPLKNFLLANAYDATDNHRFEYKTASKRRSEWKEAHTARMEAADVKRIAVAEEKRASTVAILERKERERSSAIQERESQARQELLEQFQHNWLRHIALTLRHKWLRDARLNLQPMRIESFRKNLAAKRIQTFIRANLAIKRKMRASLNFQAFRSMILFMANNYSIVKKDRAATTLKHFLEAKNGVDSVRRVIKNFSRRVGICQRAFRRWIAVKASKKLLWRSQYLILARMMNSPVLLEDTVIRDRILETFFQDCKKSVMHEWDEYQSQLQAYNEHLEQEKQKKLLISDHVIEFVAKPVRPKVPVLIPPAILTKLVENAVHECRNIALANLKTTTENQQADALNLPSPTGEEGRRSSKGGKRPTTRNGRGSGEYLGVESHLTTRSSSPLPRSTSRSQKSSPTVRSRRNSITMTQGKL